MLGDVECLCEFCPKLEVLVCGTVVDSGKADMIKKAISDGENLRSLTLQIDWIPGENAGFSGPSETASDSSFTVDDAREMMLESKLRFISVNDIHYTGQWVLAKEEPSEDDEGKGEPVTDQTTGKKSPKLEFAKSLIIVVTILVLVTMLSMFHEPSRAYIDPWTGQLFGEGGVEPHGPPKSFPAVKNAKGGVIMPKLGNETAKAELGRATWKLINRRKTRGTR
ncbi:hypothetical protein NMY22_g9521 [Coprinellus aureogranulatus]|nr:hypothetical protein NMY22_g9521 [Coprinellus aureogranulatus]